MKKYNDIIDLSYPWFAQRPVTPDTLWEFIERMKLAFADTPIDDQELFEKLEAKHCVGVNGDAIILDGKNDFEEWFNVSTNRPLHRDFEWHLWDHLKAYLRNIKRRPKDIVESIDKFSSEILSRLEDPEREGGWDRRGVVMGSVQSGKTANYTALICKALDAGYKLVIVLAGVHNSLRSQTQDRLNEELLGYDLDRVQRLTGNERKIGVRTLFSGHRVVNTLTSSSHDGDFKHTVAKQAGIIPSRTGDPIVLIVKKNVSILRNLITWLSSLPDVVVSDQTKYIPDIPMMIIDDECDYASVNTKQPERDEDDKIVADWDPAQTNKRIRQLLSLFQKRNYVGYTATPYANIFIHKDEKHPHYGEDLFPKDFVISLPQPDNYIGPEKIFGMSGDDSTGIESISEYPLVRTAEDYGDLIPPSHKKDHVVDGLPDSLVLAVKHFLLTCAARALREEGTPHNSMLIHVTRFTNVQGQIKDIVESLLKSLVARVMAGPRADPLNDFKEIWESDFEPTILTMKGRGFKEASMHSWSDVRSVLYESSRQIRVKAINGETGDILEYREVEVQTREKRKAGQVVPWVQQGLSVIAIGGDKLSRGLTLDGLSVSYYLRASRMYDTLMQMGRWFGYRDGYNDLCRIFTTHELSEWYSHIALANLELRNDLDYMRAINGTPDDFQLKVRSHPGRLAVTSAGKSRRAERLSLSYAGQLQQTIVFDPDYLEHNRNCLSRFVDDLGANSFTLEEEKTKPRFKWNDVAPETVLGFLKSYKIHEDVGRIVNPDLMANYIEKQLLNDELKTWTVVIVSNATRAPHSFDLRDNIRVGCTNRVSRMVDGNKISIGVLTSPVDEVLDLDEDEYERAKAFETNSKGLPTPLAIREIRPKERGLLLIYMPAYNQGKSYGLKGEEVVGFAVSFPTSNTAVPVDYWASPVYEEDNVGT